jgi:hypothetical protein
MKSLIKISLLLSMFAFSANAAAACSGQVLLATSLCVIQCFFSDSFGDNPLLFRCGLTRL